MPSTNMTTTTANMDLYSLLSQVYQNSTTPTGPVNSNILLAAAPQTSKPMNAVQVEHLNVGSLTSSLDRQITSIRNVALIGMMAVAVFGLAGSPVLLIGSAAITLVLLHALFARLAYTAHQLN